jgi:hypothetical protein
VGGLIDNKNYLFSTIRMSQFCGDVIRICLRIGSPNPPNVFSNGYLASPVGCWVLCSKIRKL